MSWISGTCSDDPEDRPTVVVFLKRPEGADPLPPSVEEDGKIIWVDAGSGSGFELPFPDNP